MNSDHSNRKRLLSYFWPHRWKFSAALVMVTIHSAIPASLVLIIQKILDEALIEKDKTMLWLLPISLCGLYLLNGILSVSRGMLTHGISWQVVSQLRNEVFQQMIYLPLKWRHKQPLGKLLSTLSHDVNQVQYAVSAIITAVQKPLTLIGLIAAAFYMNTQLATIGLILIPLVAWPISHFGKKLREAANQEREQHAVLQQTAAEILLGVKAIKSHNAEDFYLDAFATHNQQLRSAKMRAIAARLVPSAAVELIAAIGVGVAIYYGGKNVLTGDLLPGELIAFMVALGLLNAPLKGLSEMQSLWQRSMVGANAIFAILDHQLPTAKKGMLLTTRNVKICFQNVYFDYQEEPVLRNISFSVTPNNILAIQGPSGCGKTTIASLLLGFHRQQKGQILIDDIPLEEYQVSSIRENISIVYQESFLFHTTILENLTMGKAYPRDQVENACKKAHIHDFISELPNGYQTIVQESGQRLSGGQRQRICIARALLRDSPIVILDEPTSQLDETTAKGIMEAINNLMKNRTVIVISHQPQIVQQATTHFSFV